MGPLAEGTGAQAVQECKGHAGDIHPCVHGYLCGCGDKVCDCVWVGWVCAPVCGGVQGCGQG